MTSTNDRSNVAPLPARRIIATPLNGRGVHVAVPGRNGSWSFTTDTADPTREMVAPPPAYLGLAAWAAWTVVTLVGVAYRGDIPLEDIRVDFAVEEAPSGGLGVREQITLIGTLTDSQQLRLRRAAGYCPVGQVFTKGSLEIQSDLVVGDRVTPLEPPEVGGHSETEPVPVPSGSVSARYRIETQERVDGSMTEEGEVEVYMTCEDSSAHGHWTVLAGHTTEGWVPPPVPLALAALATSVASTLSEQTWSTSGFQVEVASTGAPGGRDQSQADAAEGLRRERPISLRIVSVDPTSDLKEGAVRDALLRDPLLRIYQGHDQVLLGEEMLDVRPGKGWVWEVIDQDSGWLNA